MKGAIGNAFILNMVITFIVIFYMLLIGSVAYTKAYKTKNYIINAVDQYEINQRSKCETKPCTVTYKAAEWNPLVNEYLGKIGYMLSTDTCPIRLNRDSYDIWRNHRTGEYDYCIYKKIHDNNDVMYSYNYMVEIYMKFDFPIIGKYIKLPVRGETKTYSQFK